MCKKPNQSRRGENKWKTIAWGGGGLKCLSILPFARKFLTLLITFVNIIEMKRIPIVDSLLYRRCKLRWYDTKKKRNFC